MPAAPPGESPVSPRARKAAERFGVNAARLAGSGPGGRVVEADVTRAADAGVRLTPAANAEAAATGKSAPIAGGTGIGWQVRLRDLADGVKAKIEAPEEEEGTPPEIPYKGIRKLIGDRMRQSLADHAQLTLNASADATELMAFRQAVKTDGKALGLPNVTLNDLVCWVVAQTLPRFPEVNAVFDIPGERVVPSRRAHLGVAVDTPRGLMVPVIRNADRLPLALLSKTIAHIAEEARQGKVNPDLLAGGTFTVTNLGSLGVETFTPIVNAPQVAVLGVCAIRDVAAPDGSGGVCFRPRMGLSLTIDHQVVDGAPGARFLQAVAAGIENVRTTLSLWGAVAR
jgi:pyruvate dehydrogenase E2 component (dihydrolipoamide acetyltransferase)